MSEERTNAGLSSSDLLGRRAIVPEWMNLKGCPRGYKGRGWIGTVIEQGLSKGLTGLEYGNGELVKMRFSDGRTRIIHKSHLSLLRPNSVDMRNSVSPNPNNQ